MIKHGEIQVVQKDHVLEETKKTAVMTFYNIVDENSKDNGTMVREVFIPSYTAKWYKIKELAKNNNLQDYIDEE